MFYIKFRVREISFLLLWLINSSTSAKLRCYRTVFENYTEVSIDTPEILINSTNPCIDVNKGTVFFIFGYLGQPLGPAVSVFIPGLLRLKIINVVLVNWQVEASGGLYGPLIGYPFQAVPETKKVGAKLGRALMTLIKLGMKLENTHVIGHSIGAHVAGYAGTETQKEGQMLPWITGLDPGRIGFDPPSLAEPINKTCAAFVDIVHCDPGGYAINKSLGHLDIWPNYGAFVSGNRLQPGCTILDGTPLDVFTAGNFCNHNRCVFYYNASLVFEKSFEAGEAAGYYAWVKHDGNSTDTTFLGLSVDKIKRGDFYLSTFSTYSWGKETDGLRP